MQNQLHSCVQKLNRVSQLYDYSIQVATPYRIGRIRALHHTVVEYANTQFGITDFNSKLYSQFFGENKTLKKILQKKNEAIDSNEYELAADLRDKEIIIIRSLLSEIGVNVSSKFFVKDNRIYRIA